MSNLPIITNPADFNGLNEIREIINAMPDSDDKSELLARYEQAEQGNGWALNDLAYWMLRGEKGFTKPNNTDEYAVVYDLYRQADLNGVSGASDSAEFVRGRYLTGNLFAEPGPEDVALEDEDALTANTITPIVEARTDFGQVNQPIYDDLRHRGDYTPVISVNDTQWAAIESGGGFELPQGSLLNQYLYDYTLTVTALARAQAQSSSLEEARERLQNSGQNNISNELVTSRPGFYRQIFVDRYAEPTELQEGIGAVLKLEVGFDPDKLSDESSSNDMEFSRGNLQILNGLVDSSDMIEPGEIIQIHIDIPGGDVNDGARLYRFTIPDQEEAISVGELIAQIQNRSIDPSISADLDRITMEENIYKLTSIQSSIEGATRDFNGQNGFTNIDDWAQTNGVTVNGVLSAAGVTDDPTEPEAAAIILS